MLQVSGNLSEVNYTDAVIERHNIAPPKKRQKERKTAVET